MSTVGKVCLVITLLLLLVAFLPIPGPYGGWTPKLLVIHSQWSEKFRDARQKTLDAQRSHDLARQELSKATADVDSLTIGWAQFWNIPARGPNNPPNAPQINIDNNGRLQTTNLGSDHGLKQRSFDDAQGASKTMSPTVHAFVAGAEGYVYAGEYIATQTTPNSAVLTPVQNLRDRAAFLRQNIGGNWRLRTLIPTAKRMTRQKRNQSLLPQESAERKKIKESTQLPNCQVVHLHSHSHTHHQMQTQTTQTRKNQRLPPHGRRVH